MGDVVEGNFIGTDITGTIGLGNFDDHYIDSADITSKMGERYDRWHRRRRRQRHLRTPGMGFTILNPGAADDVIEGNFIGTDNTGTRIVERQWDLHRQHIDGGLITIGGAAA